MLSRDLVARLKPVAVAAAIVICVSGLAGLVGHTSVMPEPLTKQAFEIEIKEPVPVMVASAGGAASAAATKTDAPDPILGLIASADVTKGAKIAKQCMACHGFDKGGAHKVGPNQWNLLGSQKAHHGDYKYSEALKAMGGVWGYTELNAFLTKPRSYVPGTKMAYAGLRKVEDRAALIAWLRLQADTPFPLPTEAEIAAEQVP